MQDYPESIAKPRDNQLYLGDYGSRLRDMSVIIFLLNKHPIPVKESKTLIFQLADELNNRQYLSTQERNALFRVGMQLKSMAKSEWQGDLVLDNILLKLQQTGGYQTQFMGDDIPKGGSNK